MTIPKLSRKIECCNLKITEKEFKTGILPFVLHTNIPRLDPPAFVDEFISPLPSLLLIFVWSFFIASYKYICKIGRIRIVIYSKNNLTNYMYYLQVVIVLPPNSVNFLNQWNQNYESCSNKCPAAAQKCPYCKTVPIHNIKTVKLILLRIINFGGGVYSFR